MKRILLLVLFLSYCFIFKSYGQLPDGATAPNWTLTDLDGNTWTLYDILDQGKPVVLDFSATWCGPCWNYHNTGILESLYEQYGPDGTDEIMVFFLEADTGTNTACLYGPSGCSGGTQGNWVAGTPYPIIDLQNNVVNSGYNIGYFPTLYAISPDHLAYEVGQQSQGVWEDWLFDSFGMDATGVSSDAICPNAGGVDLTVSQGFGQISYEWSNGSTSQDLTGVNVGTYSVVITDGHGYSITRSFNVDGPAEQFNLDDVTQYNVSCFGANDGYLSINPSGGYPGYSVQWSNGSDQNIISDLSPATYSVVVTDQEGCTISESFVIEQPQILTCTATTQNAQCNANNGTVYLEGNGGTQPYLYTLSNGASSSNNLFNGLAAGNYTYLVTDYNFCTKTGSFVINSVGAPSAQATANGSLDCVNTQTTMSAAGSSTGSNITYLWTTTNGHIVSGETTQSPVVDAGGVYTLAVTNSSNNCSMTASATVQQTFNGPTANAGTAGNLTCATTQLNLDGSASSSGNNFTYLWTTSNGNIVSGNTTTTPLINAAGTYNLLVTNLDNGCVANSNVAVVANTAPPALSVSNAQMVCGVTSVEICATVEPNVSVVWNINGTNHNSNCVSVTNSGSFTATATGPNGCNASAVSVVSPAVGQPEIGVQSPSPLTCLVPEITITGTVNGDPSQFNINWTTTNGNIVNGSNTLTPVVNLAGDYVMTVINPANSCQSSLTIAVQSINNTPVAEYTSTVTNGLLTLNSTATATGTVSWDLGNGQSATGNSVTVTYPTSGTYNVCMTLTNECGTNTVCNNIEYISALAVSGTITPFLCFGSGTASISTSITGGPPTGIISYVWTGPNGFTSTEAIITVSEPGLYTVVITDEAGLTSTAAFNLNYPPALEASPTITHASNGQSNGEITLAIGGGTGTVTITWNNGGTGSTISGLAPASYTAIATDVNGCQKTFGPFVVENINNVEDPAFITKFSVFPNPTSSVINLNLNTVKPMNLIFNIYGVTGNKVWSNDLSGSSFTERVDVSTFNSGLYFVEVVSDEGVTMRKFIVSR